MTTGMCDETLNDQDALAESWWGSYCQDYLLRWKTNGRTFLMKLRGSTGTGGGLSGNWIPTIVLC